MPETLQAPADDLVNVVDHDYELYASAAFKGARAVMLVPTMYHVEPEMFESLFLAGQRFGRDQLRFMSREKTCIWVSRNILAHRFLATDAEYAIFVDGDMCVPCGMPEYYRKRFRNTLPDRYAGKNLIERLLSHPREYGIIGGAYFDRQVGMQLQCSRGCGTEEEIGFNARFRAGSVSGIVECRWVATGAMRIARWVFEKIIAQQDLFPEMIPQRTGSPLGFFTPFRVAQGEDVSFCMRAGRLGIKSWLDAELRVMHKGSAYF